MASNRVKHGHTRTVAKQMLHAWNDGMASQRNPRPVV